MHMHTQRRGGILHRAAGLMLAAVLTLGMVMSAFAADSYTAVGTGTVSWQMIHDNAGTYYWKDKNGGYCALTAGKSGSTYYVSLYRSDKDELRYLRQKKSDDSGSMQKWSGASAVYTGGALYKKAGSTSGGSDSGSGSGSGSSSGSGSGSGSGSSSAGTVAPDGTYKADGTVSFSKDNYSFTLTLTVSGGKIASMSQTITTATQESKSKSEYQPKAMSALSSALVGKSASTETVDAVSSGTPRYSFAALKAAAREAIATASGSSSDSGSEGGYTPVTESEIGKGVGEKTGTRYTGKGVIADEYITLDVYISGGKITGLFIADEVGDWLNLLTAESTNYIGKSADLAAVNAVTSATTLGFRNTIRDAVANAVAKADTSSGSGTGEGSGTGSSTGSYKVDGYDKKYSYTDLNSGKYYFLYKGTYYPVKGLKYYSSDKGKNYYCGYFEINGIKYYLDKTPQAYTSRQLSKEHPGDDSASKAYESCKQDKVYEGKELPLYTK